MTVELGDFRRNYFASLASHRLYQYGNTIRTPVFLHHAINSKKIGGGLMNNFGIWGLCLGPNVKTALIVWQLLASIYLQRIGDRSRKVKSVSSTTEGN